MDIAELYHFLFETYAGIGVLVGAGIILSIIVSIIFEIRTRKLYKNHERTGNDEWSIFGDDEDEDGEGDEGAKKGSDS